MKKITREEALERWPFEGSGEWMDTRRLDFIESAHVHIERKDGRWCVFVSAKSEMNVWTDDSLRGAIDRAMGADQSGEKHGE